MEYVVLSGAILSAVIIALYLRKMMMKSYTLTLEKSACQVTNRFWVMDKGPKFASMFWSTRYTEWLEKHELNPHTVDYEWWLEMVVDGDIRV